MKIRFTEDRWLDTEDRTKTPKFKKGSTHDLPESSAFRWVRRDVAVYVTASVAEVKINRPMMTKAKFTEWADGKPKKTKRAKKPKGDATVREFSTGPALPVKGSGKNGGPGWND